MAHGQVHSSPASSPTPSLATTTRPQLCSSSASSSTRWSPGPRRSAGSSRPCTGCRAPRAPTQPTPLPQERLPRERRPGWAWTTPPDPPNLLAGRSSLSQAGSSSRPSRLWAPAARNYAQQQPAWGAHPARGLSAKNPSGNTVSPDREALASTLRRARVRRVRTAGRLLMTRVGLLCGLPVSRTGL